MIYAAFHNSYNPRPFNSEDWKKDEFKRIELIDDLIESKILDTLSRTEIISLLGKPEKEPSYFTKSGRDLIYFLGPQRTGWAAPDSEWLLIWLKEDAINEYEIWID